MKKLKEITDIEWEITNKCNLSCPMCPRNEYGGNVIPELKLYDFTLKDVQNIINFNEINLKHVYFCGTYGDPCANKNLLEIIEWFKFHNVSIGIHTNGSLRNKTWWNNLSNLMNDNDFVAFAIDGLEDTNHVYRRNSDWYKILENIRSFSGTKHWDFIVFKHNEHQIETAKKLAKELKFASFNVKKTSRFINKKHEKISFLNVNDEYNIYPPLNKKYVNESLFEVENKYHKISCFYNEKNKIYIGADGYVFPCGWLHDRLYGPEVIDDEDRKKIFNIFNKKNNVFKNSLKTIVNQQFLLLEKTFENKPLKRCQFICGNSNNMIRNQNSLVEGYSCDNWTVK